MLSIAHSQVQADCESFDEQCHTLKNWVAELTRRITEVLEKAADLRKERDRFEDLSSRSEEQIANLRFELGRAKQREVFEHRASAGEARDRGGLM